MQILTLINSMNVKFRWMKNRSLLLPLMPFLWSFFLILSACGGGGGGAGSPASITADFLATSPSVSSNLIAITRESVQGDTVTLNVAVTSLSTLSSGAAFDLVFDPTLVSYVSFTSGTFYESNNSTIVDYQVALQSGTNNRLVVGITQQNGSGVKDSGVMIQLTFKTINIGSSNPAFQNNNLLSTSPVSLIPGLTWVSGAIMGS